MADYTDLPNSAVGVGGIPSGTTVTALRDNPIAIAEGAAGAPRIQTSAVADGAVTESKLDRAYVEQGGGAGMATNNIAIGWSGSSLLAQVSDSPQGAIHTSGLGTGALGTYATLRWDASPLNGSPGTLVAGGSLVYTNAEGTINAAAPVSPAGTWQLMGFTRNTNDQARTSSWLRKS